MWPDCTVSVEKNGEPTRRLVWPHADRPVFAGSRDVLQCVFIDQIRLNWAGPGFFQHEVELGDRIDLFGALVESVLAHLVSTKL